MNIKGFRFQRGMSLAKFRMLICVVYEYLFPCDWFYYFNRAGNAALSRPKASEKAAERSGVLF